MKAGGKPKFKYKRVKIIWQDIITDAGWFDSLEDVEKLTFQWCEDIGYLFSKDTKTVKIFTSFIVVLCRNFVNGFLILKL